MSDAVNDVTPADVPRLHPPFEFNGGNLGIGMSLDGPTNIRFIDRIGQDCDTDSVEFILRNIHHFADERDRKRLLCGAALHYGFDDPWTLINGRVVSQDEQGDAV